MDSDNESLGSLAGARSRVGTVLCGKYRLDAVLGIGGMATVYVATHLRNANRVAVKILHRELSIDAGQRARFVREGYAANSVAHPGTVRVLDDDTAEDGSVFLVMELLDGETLDARWERSDRKLGVRETVTLMTELLDVLHAAHAKGIVHRDLKPENLFLARDGKLRVLDFGVARLREGSATTTKTGSLFGTPAFMAPEQALGRTSEVDARSDLYAVGATAFTLLAGRFVHMGRTAEEMLVLSATQPAPPLASVVPDVPPILADIVDRALAFDKAARWPSAQAMREALLQADKIIRSGEQPEDSEDDEDENTRLALPPEMTLRGEIEPPIASGLQQFTVEISTLRESSTVAGVESHSAAKHARRGFPVIGVVVGGIGISIAVALIAALSGGSAHPALTGSASASSAFSGPSSAASVATPSVSAPAPVAEPQAVDVETLPVAKPAVLPAPAETVRSVASPKPVVPAPTTRPAPAQAVPPPIAVPAAAPAKKRDPLAP